MHNNNEFKQHLLISYLALLADKNYIAEFDRLFPQVETFLQSLVANSDNKELLIKVEKIVSFRNKAMQITV